MYGTELWPEDVYYLVNCTRKSWLHPNHVISNGNLADWRRVSLEEFLTSAAVYVNPNLVFGPLSIDTSRYSVLL